MEEGKGKKARILFEQGYNCAQSVAGAFAKEMRLTEDTVFLLSSAFGGGMGRLREVCGAISGAAMVLGALRGYLNPSDAKGKKRLYAETQEFVQRFRMENGAIICRELLGLPGGTSEPTPEERTPEYYRKRPCPELVECAANLLETYLNELETVSESDG